jgi:hypothetical protein
MCFCLNPQALNAEIQPAKLSIAVLFPRLQAPYDQIFKSIIEGVGAAHQGPLTRVELTDSMSAEELRKAVQAQADAVIALGNRSVEMLLQIQPNPDRVMAGAVLMEQQDDRQLNAISIAPDPELLFRHLLQLAPSVKTIHVIHQKGQDRQVLAEAETAARLLNVKLQSTATESLQELADTYRKLLKQQNPRTEALWIPHTGTSLDQAIMSRVLRDAWNRSLIVFSSNLADVRKGALFSLYPDNHAMGRSLITSLYKHLEKPDVGRTVDLCRDLHAAINTRTASHLGIHLSPSELSSYRLIYPEGR